MPIITSSRSESRPSASQARLLLAGCLAALTFLGSLPPTAAHDRVDDRHDDEIVFAPDRAERGEIALVRQRDHDRRGGPRLAPPRANHAIYGHCQLDFNDQTVLSTLMPEVHDGFVSTSGWNQSCIAADGINISVQPEAPHGHLFYEDEQVTVCGQLGFKIGRHTDPRPVAPTAEEYDSWDEDAQAEWDSEWSGWINGPCTEIDPLTEPRRGIQPHANGFSLSLFAYKSHGKKYLPITIGQLRVVDGASEICHRAAGPVLAIGQTDPWSCVELEPGNWDLSNNVVNAGEVRITALTDNSVVTDIGIWTSAP